MDNELAHYALLALGCTVAVILVWSTLSRLTCYIRRIAGLSNERQRYFVPAHKWLAVARKHILYAPLFHNRHHREFQLSRAINMGTLPSRIHSFILIGILAMNIALCTVNVPYHTGKAVGVIQKRTGTMAITNLIPLVLLASRNSPLIPLLRVPYDTFNLFHRWLARIVVLEALVHVFTWCVPKAQMDPTIGWDAVRLEFEDSAFIRSGLIAACAFVFLLIHSPSPIRHAFYETFLHLHIAMAATGFALLWIHLDGRSAQSFLLGAIVLWSLERSARIVTILYRNCGRRLTTAVIEALPDGILRIALRMPRPWTVAPGQHIFLYIPAIGLWTSHPFSVCWSEEGDGREERTTIYLLVRRRTGFTDTLAQRVKRSTNCVLSMRAIVEGPYGGIHSLDSYGTVILFAGGIGITHHLPFLHHIVRGHASGTVAARRITLVWAIRSPSCLEWFDAWMSSILGKKEESFTPLVVQILVYITGSCDVNVVRRPMGTVEIFTGRPSFDKLVRREAENQIGAMGVLCCGNGSFSDDVRFVCRKAQGTTQMDFFEECFTW
ncbi:ferric reductase like transmembrane component-domain-containing protein [Talaromyces proteolyticus]|uniref:ferric-chelate reductase (NADPH) n=1 Tax=Talaromyces proteolyticus TaxID=1131652 RepID=A0AAD4Q189_9EURO|nr:ferric reductase like transmembrane component-domain-containing protein [Talaromyces proteolyticus]KAH8705370.1 ferric reductase like transmembrane component-domain-containing protein [Talaromyces proteolyticus]